MVNGEDPSVGAGALPEEAFRLIVDTTGNPFVVMDAQGTILYAGATISRVAGWSPEALVGRNMAEFLSPTSLAAAVEVISEIDDEDRAGAGIPMVFELVRPDGGTRWVEIGSMPLLDDPRVGGIVLRHRPWDWQHHLDQYVRALLADQPLDEVLTSLARAIAWLLEADAVVVHHGFDGRAFSGASGTHADGRPPPAPLLELDRGPWVAVAASAADTDHRVEDLDGAIADAARSAGFQTTWLAMVPETEALGRAVISVWREQPGRPLAGHRQALERTARYVQLALVRTAEHEQLRHLAGHDPLTGAANRAEFRDGLARALAIGERNLAVAFCDLDGFKAVNDTFGHPAGDQVLVEVAERLRGSLRVGDSLARMGGDEFTVLCRNVPDAAAAAHVIERLHGAMTAPFRVNGIDVVVGVSVGFALATPDVTADELIARADQALYEVKRSGGTGDAVWDPAGG